MKSKIFIVPIICIQVVIVAALFLQIQRKRSNILGVSVNTIDSKAVQKTPSGLKYFYEPKANTTEEPQRDWLPYIAKYTINSDTLNERFDYSVQKKPGVFRIITLDSSFTFGENVSTKDNWTEKLEDELNNHHICDKTKGYEVINLGVYGYDTQYEVERYKLRGKKYNPDLVIWMFTDYERILEKMTPLVRQGDTPENRELEKKGIFDRNWQIAREDMMKKTGTKGLIDYQSEQIKSLDAYYQGRLIFVTLPNRPEYIGLLKQRTNERSNSYFFQPAIEWGQPGLFLPDHHFNIAGNQKMMEEVVGYLVKGKLIPCSP